MLGYYSLTRRRSSQNNPNPPSPSLPLYSSSINEGESPKSPFSLMSPSSPTAEKQLQGSELGSPFSIMNPIYPFQPDPNHSQSKYSLPTLNEHEHDRDRQEHNNVGRSGGSNAPLLARDFGNSGSTRQIHENNTSFMGKGKGKGKAKQNEEDHIEEEEEENKSLTATATTSDSFNILPGDDSSLPKSSIDLPSQRDLNHKSSKLLNDPSLIPPISVHDKYVSNHIKPLTNLTSNESSLESRPSITRSTSAPGHPKDTTTINGLLPSAIPSSGTGTGPSAGETPNQGNQESNQPIYEIFNANLSEEGTEMSKKLRGYLDIVLKGQEQVGRLHLQLEGLGMGNRGIWEVHNRQDEGETEEKGKEGKNKRDAKEMNGKIEERQKGVEDIMQRLGQISDTLKNYHQLGTPKLSFPRQHPIPPHPMSPNSPNASKTKSPRTPTQTNSNALGRATTIAGPPSPELTKTTHDTQKENRPRAPTLVRSNTAIGELSPNSLFKGKVRPKSPLINTFTQFSSSDDDHHTTDGNGKRSSDLPPEKLEDGKGVPFPISPPYKGGHKPPYLDMDKLENGHQNEADHKNDRHHHWFGESPDSKSSKRERKITDSPIEMNFKSRW